MPPSPPNKVSKVNYEDPLYGRQHDPHRLLFACHRTAPAPAPRAPRPVHLARLPVPSFGRPPDLPRLRPSPGTLQGMEMMMMGLFTMNTRSRNKDGIDIQDSNHSMSHFGLLRKCLMRKSGLICAFESGLGHMSTDARRKRANSSASHVGPCFETLKRHIFSRQPH